MRHGHDLWRSALVWLGLFSWAAPAVSETLDFSIVYRITGGPHMGDGYTQRHQVLTVSGSDGTVEHEKLRSGSDAPGEPIGLFRMALQRPQLETLLKLARSSGLDDPPQPGSHGRGFGISLLELLFRDGTTEHKVTFSAWHSGVERLGPLLSELSKLMATLDAHPVAAASLTLAPEGESRFKFTLTNIGREPLCIGDPRQLPASHLDHYAAVTSAWLPPVEPGVTALPPDWRHTGLIAGKAGDPEALVLPPGASISAQSGIWEPERRGQKHLVRAVWSDYRGLAAAPACSRLRGFLISNMMQVTSP